MTSPFEVSTRRLLAALGRRCRRRRAETGRLASRPSLRAGTAAVLIVAAFACTAPDVGDAKTGDSKDDATPTATCHEVQRMPQGACCSPGHFYAYVDNACVAVGPPECASVVFSAPQTCVPRWCWSGGAQGGGACDPVVDDDCRLVGRLCTAEELAAGAGCDAGFGPDPESPQTCIAAGSFLGSGVPKDWNGDFDTLPPVPPLEDSVPDGVPPLIELPPLAESVPEGVPPLTALGNVEDTFFCRDDVEAEPHFCSKVESKLCSRGADGSLPDPGRCVYVGVPWPSRYCPPGFLVDTDAQVGQGGAPPCKPDPADCGDDQFGDAGLTDAAGVIFVNIEGGDDSGPGTRAAPLKTVGAALAASPTGGTVAVAAGIYEEAVAITQAVTIRGRCAAMVQITGEAGKPALSVDGLIATGEASVSGFHVSGPSVGVSVTGSLPARLQSVLVAAATSYGLRVNGDAAKMYGTSLVVAATQPNPANGEIGDGAVIENGAVVTLKDVRLSGNRTLGLVVVGEKTTVDASRLLVDGTLARKSDGKFGVGVATFGGATLTLHDARLAANRYIGLYVFDAASKVDATGLLIDGTLPRQSDKEDGRGVSVQLGATVVLKDTRLSGNHEVGLFVSDTGTTVESLRLIVDNTQSEETNEKLGTGAAAQSGALLKLRATRLSGNRYLGLLAAMAGTVVDADGLLVDGTLPRQSDGQDGRGVSAQLGAQVVLHNTRLSGNHEAGLFASDPGTKVESSGLLVDATQPQQSDGDSGVGVVVSGGAAVTLVGGRLSGNHKAGLFAYGKGARAKATGLVVDGTLSREIDGEYGTGVSVEGGAMVGLKDARLSANHGVGLHASGVATAVDATGALVDGTLPVSSGTERGWGVDVRAGAAVTLLRVRVSGNREIGLLASGKDVRVDATNVLVDGTLSRQSNGLWGRGVEADFGATVTLRDVRISRNRDLGLYASGADTTLDAARLLVDGTLPRENGGGFGAGVSAGIGAKVKLQSARLSGNRVAGVLAHQQGTAVDASGLLVDGTQSQQSDGEFGSGAGAALGADIRLSGSTLVGNRLSGFLGQGGESRLVGVSIRHGLPQDSDASGGSGAWFHNSASGALLASVVSANRASAVTVAGGTIEARHVVVHSTDWGKYPRRIAHRLYSKEVTQLGDGILLDTSSDSVIDHCIVANNIRTGMLIDTSPRVQVTGTLINGGGEGQYGLVYQHSADVLDQGNIVFGATKANRDSDVGLSLPATPKAAPTAGAAGS